MPLPLLSPSFHNQITQIIFYLVYFFRSFFYSFSTLPVWNLLNANLTTSFLCVKLLGDFQRTVFLLWSGNHLYQNHLVCYLNIRFLGYALADWFRISGDRSRTAHSYTIKIWQLLVWNRRVKLIKDLKVLQDLCVNVPL